MKYKYEKVKCFNHQSNKHIISCNLIPNNKNLLKLMEDDFTKC